jgi:hypothetical protein
MKTAREPICTRQHGHDGVVLHRSGMKATALAPQQNLPANTCPFPRG